jgi:hypothetical protein
MGGKLQFFMLKRRVRIRGLRSEFQVKNPDLVPDPTPADYKMLKKSNRHFCSCSDTSWFARKSSEILDFDGGIWVRVLKKSFWCQGRVRMTISKNSSGIIRQNDVYSFV